MKLLTPLTTLLLTTLATADVMSNDWANSGTCGAKNPSTNTAIEQFCSKGDIVVPSDYASNGVNVDGVVVKVTGQCGYQWLPPAWCRAQFHAVCANGGPHAGGGHRVFNGCQKFVIERVKHN